ncbi:MAG: beta strand repeat-containing protein, partial [Candidatus Thorarchaeota archaeon]
MAYEISSSVANSTFSLQALTASFNGTFERGMAISPDGTMAAASTYRHGASDPGSTDYGINIYMSSSGTGWAFDHSIDVGSSLVSHLKWRTSTDLWGIQSNRMTNYVSSSGGWSQGSIYATGLFTGGKAKWRFNPSKTILALWKGGSSSPVVMYSGSAGGTSWSNSDIRSLSISGITNDAVGFAWVNDTDFVIGDPTYNSNRGRVMFMKSSDNGGTWSVNSGELMNGASSTTSGKHQLGIWLWYHTGSNTLLVQAAQNDSQSIYNRIYYWQSSSAEGIIPASDNSLVELTRSYSPFVNGYTSDQEGNGDAILSIENYNGSYPDQQTVVIETGSAGWKVTKVGTPVRNLTGLTDAISFGPSSAGGVISVPGDLSGGSNPAVNRFFSMIASNPALAASVTSSIGTSGGTLKAGGTENSPAIQVTVPANALSGDTSLSAEVVSDATYKWNNLSSIKKQAGSADAELVGDIFRMTPHGQNFSSAVTVQLELASAPSDLQIWKRDSHEGNYTQWYRLPDHLWSNSGTTVTINTTRFSEFAGLGGINVARTKLNNSRLVTLTSTDLVDSTSIRVSGSNTGKNLTVAAGDLFILETGGATYRVSASQMAEYFGGLVSVSASSDNSDMRMTFVSPDDSTDVGLAVDAGILYNPSSNTLKGTNLSGSGTLQIAGNTDLAGTLDVVGLISGSGGLDIAGAADFGAAVNIQGALDVDGATTLDALTVAEAADFSSTLSVTGLISGSGGIDIAGAADFGAAVNVQGALDVDGATTLDGLTVAEAADFSSTVSVTGLISGSGGIDIAGAADFGAAVNVQGALDVDGATTLDALTVAEAAVFQSTISGSGNISGGGDLRLDGAAELRSTLSVEGNADLNGQLDVAGATSLAASGVLTDIRGTLSVDEAATFDSSVTIAGNLTVQGTTTSVDSQNTLIEDPLMVLGSSSNGVSADGDRGLILELSGSNNKAMFWDQSAGEFAFVDTTSNHDATVVATTAYANLHIGALDADAASSFGGDVTVTGDVSASANLYAAGAVTASFFSGDGSGLTGVGAEVLAASSDSIDLQLAFTSGTAAAAQFFIDSGSITYNPGTDTLKSVN